MDGDVVRTPFTRSWALAEDRDANIRRMGFVASRSCATAAVICAAVSPYRRRATMCAAWSARNTTSRYTSIRHWRFASSATRRAVRRGARRDRGLHGRQDPYEPPPPRTPAGYAGPFAGRKRPGYRRIPAGARLPCTHRLRPASRSSELALGNGRGDTANTTSEATMGAIQNGEGTAARERRSRSVGCARA